MLIAIQTVALRMLVFSLNCLPNLFVQPQVPGEPQLGARQELLVFFTNEPTFQKMEKYGY